MNTSANIIKPFLAPARTKSAQTALYFASFVALGLTTASLGPTLMGLAAQTNVGLGAASLIIVARSLGYPLGSLLCGKLFDRAPGHRVLAAMLLMLALTAALVPFAPALWLLLTVSLVMGLAEGGVDVSGNTLLVWTRSGNAGYYLNVLHFFFGVGALLAPLLAAQSYARSQDVRLAYWAIAALILPLAWWTQRVPGPTARGAQTTGASLVPRHTFTLIVLFFFFYAGVEFSFGAWIYTYAIAVNLGTATTAAYLTSAFWGAFTLGRLLAIPLAARFRPRAILCTDLAGALLCLGLLLWSPSATALWGGTIGLGLFLASVFPTIFAFAERRMAITGRVTSRFIVGASLGCKVFPLLIGQLFTSAGPRSFLLVALAALFCAALLFTILLRVANARI